jgi:tetratricopeptide (TPR) repeat protein
MRRFIRAGAAVAALALAGRAPAATPESLPIAPKLYAAIQAYDADRYCAIAEPAIVEVVASPDFAGLGQQAQSDAFRVQASCAIDRQDMKAAYAALLKAAGYSESPDWIFVSLFETASALDRQEDAVAALELATAKRPASLEDLPSADLYRFLYALDNQGRKELGGHFLAALDRADYRPAEPFRTGSFLWLEYAGDLADAGDTASAARVLGRIDVPEAVARALTDRRLVSLTDADLQRFDVRAIAERRLALDRRAMAAHPELLDGPNEIAMELRALDRPEEALALLDATLPKLKDKAAFRDLADRLPWFWDERSRTLRELGRVDDAIDALRTGAFAADPDKPDVSLILNLSDFLIWAGKPQAALDELAIAEKVDAQTSPYGRMVREQTRACAFAKLGKSAELKASLADIAAHASDNWSAAVDAPLCAGDLDMAAAAVIGALADPEGRWTVLIELSQFDPPAHQTELERQMDARRAELAKRPDVQAAIAKVGRTMRFRVGRPEG